MSKKSGKPGPDPGTGGRPKKEITEKILDNLIKIQCTEKEIAAVFDCTKDTIQARIREWTGNPDMTFSTYFKQKGEVGKVSLRRKQWKLADKNVAMAIFLGKNLLGQRDVKEIKAKHDIMSVDIPFTAEEQEAYKQRMVGFLGGEVEDD